MVSKFMKNKKRMLATIIMAISLTTPFNVYAASCDSVPSVVVGNMKGYIYEVSDKANKRCKVYADESLETTKGNEYVDVMTDEIKLIKLSDVYDSVCIEYPTAKGKKQRWVSSRTLGLIKPFSVATASTKCTTYYFSRDEFVYGHLSAGDTFFVYYDETKSGFTRIIYPLDGGGYKAAWIKTNDLNNAIGVPGYSKPDDGIAGRFADIAINEVGYLGNGDKTKYNNYNNQPWCASFVCWCADQSGISSDIIPRSASCINMLSKSRYYRTWDDSAMQNMKKGDVIFFSTEKRGSNNSHHVGIVTNVDASSGKITLVEGNTSSDRVKQNTYTVNVSSGKITKGWSGHWFCGYISV